MILDFADSETECIWRGERSRKLPSDIQEVARRKLRMINRAKVPGDLRAPPGNRFEELKGNRKGTYSIRINRQWRICFTWADGDAEDVRIEDYHD
jgi:proteic killer suppression protein